MIEFEDWYDIRRKNKKNKCIKKRIDISYNEYDTYYSENDYDR